MTKFRSALIKSPERKTTHAIKVVKRLSIEILNLLVAKFNASPVGRNFYEAGQKEHQITIPAKSPGAE